MPSLKDLKTRIKSVKSTQKITKAMKVVAAAKLNRARSAAESARPYAVAMEGMVARLAASQQGMEMTSGRNDEMTKTGRADSSIPQFLNSSILLTGTGRDDVHLLVVVTADRGLSGAFNSSIVRAAKKRIRELQTAGKTVKIYTIGRKGRDWLGGEFKSLFIGSKVDIAKGTSYRMAEGIAEEIFADMDANGIDRITMLYNQFRSVISQVVTFQQLMPLEVASGQSSAASKEKEDSGHSSPATGHSSYDYEPSEEEILADLLPRNFAMQIFSALLENNAGFYGAQMNAMENATKNAGEMIKKLTLKYNRTRQANITKELIEIISGAEAI